MIVIVPPPKAQDLEGTSIYAKEQAAFAKMQADLQRRKRALWRLWLALKVAGRRGMSANAAPRRTSSAALCNR